MKPFVTCAALAPMPSMIIVVAVTGSKPFSCVMVIVIKAKLIGVSLTCAICANWFCPIQP